MIQLCMETVCNQLTVNTGFRLEEEQVMPAEHDILSETVEATGFLQHLNSNEATEPTEEEELEQTGPSFSAMLIFKVITVTMQQCSEMASLISECHCSLNSDAHSSTFFYVGLQI